MQACDKGGAWQEAEKLLERLRSERGVVDVAICNGCLSAYASAGRWQEAMNLLMEMKQNGSDVTSYNCVIRACGNGSQLNRALWLFDDMKKSAVEPNIITYNTILTGCSRAGEWRKALDIYNNLIRNVDPNLPKPTTVTHGAILQSLERAGLWEKSLEIIQTMWDSHLEPTPASYTLAINACTRANRDDKAQQLYQTMLERGIQPSDHAKNAYHAAVARSGQWEQALSLLEKKDDNDPYAFAVTIESLGRAGQFEKIIQMLDGVDSNLMNEQAFNSLLNGVADYIIKQEPPSWDESQFGWRLLDIYRQKGGSLTPRAAFNLLSCVIPQNSSQKHNLCQQILDQLKLDNHTPDVLLYAKLATIDETNRSYWARCAAQENLLPFWHGTKDKRVDYHQIPPPLVRDVTNWALQTCCTNVDLVLVCGRATHTLAKEEKTDSNGNKISVLREAIISALKSEGVEEVHPGRRNPGRLVVPRNELIRWRRINNLITL